MFETDTYKKLKNKKQDNFPKMLIIHHSGGTNANPLADTSHHTAKMMEKWHLQKGWEGLGYQFVIHKNGDVWKGRPETYHGAHETTHNKDSIGICLAGNFDATMPTEAQIKALKVLMVQMCDKWEIPHSEVYPHRQFANKTCYGTKLSQTWAMELLKEAGKPIDNCTCIEDMHTMDILKEAWKRLGI